MGAPKNPRARRGFTLVEILVVIVILGLVMAMAAVLLRSVSAAQKRSITATRMANVEAAIVQFVMQQKRLPCPADGTMPSSSGGNEMRGAGGACTNNQQNGVAPWKALGLTPSDILDGWDRRFTYRTDPKLALDGGMDLSWCDPAGLAALAGTSCVPSCTRDTCSPPSAYLTGKGLLIRNVSGADLTSPNAPAYTGAAYVLISHGESGGGAYLDTGVLSTSTSTDGTEEQRNYANAAWTGAAYYYVDDQTSDVAGATHFDDIVLRPSILNVASKAGLGPRSH